MHPTLRRVRIYFDYSGDPIEWVLVDVGTSGRSGGWAGWGYMNDQFGFVSATRADGLRRNIGRKKHRHLCRGQVAVATT